MTQPPDQTTSPPVSSMSVLHALGGLLYVDYVLKRRGYKRVQQMLSRCPVATADGNGNGSTRKDAQAIVLAAVDRAAVIYPKRAMCLQRSAVLTWLLRKKGVPAQMVIGCRHTPFYAHAWVEVDRIVINDRESVRQQYPEMVRV